MKNFPSALNFVSTFKSNSPDSASKFGGKTFSYPIFKFCSAIISATSFSDGAITRKLTERFVLS